MGRMRLVLLIITIFCGNYVTSQCVKQDSCFCMGQNYKAYDLSTVKTLGPFSAKNDTIRFQPCANANLAIDNSKSNNCGSTSLCLLDNNTNTNIGQLEESHWQWSLPRNPQLIFIHGQYISHIEMFCPTFRQKADFQFINRTGNNLYFEFFAPQICVDMSTKGLSTGSILVILFFTFLGIYFIGGSAFLIFHRGTLGKEVIPNFQFWADLPGLVRDGVLFIRSRGFATNYQQI